jgi:hypothetical protein
MDLARASVETLRHGARYATGMEALLVSGQAFVPGF